MKLVRLFSLLILLSAASSCAMMFNDKNVDVSIASNPPGANILIDGRNYGRTPATLNLEPRNYNVILTKEGYGSAPLKLESWTAIRSKEGEGGRCIADILGTMFVIPYYSFYWSGRCDEFKQSEYFVNIPNSAGGSSMGNSMRGFGKNPSDMINYYYDQNSMNNGDNAGQYQMQQGYRGQ